MSADQVASLKHSIYLLKNWSFALFQEVRHMHLVLKIIFFANHNGTSYNISYVLINRGIYQNLCINFHKEVDNMEGSEL